MVATPADAGDSGAAAAAGASSASSANASTGRTFVTAHDTTALIDTFSDPAVRDLAWLLFSAPLVRPQPTAPLATLFDDTADPDTTIDWLRHVDRAPAALHDELAQGRITRVGRLAEALLAWYLRTGPGPRLVAANVPLRRAGVTLGECDFLVETRDGRRLHWELAVKCYLHAGAMTSLAGAAVGGGHVPTPGLHLTASLSDYVGPNLQDRFDLKLAHLLDHQLPLSGRPEFASTGHRGPWTPQMLVRGWLFYPHDMTPPEAAQIDPAHGRGWWVTLAGWPAFATAHAERWRVLPRLEWLAPRRDASTQTFDDIDTLASRCAQQRGPVMVVGLVADGQGGWRESSRGFIVPDAWPAQARRFADQ